MRLLVTLRLGDDHVGHARSDDGADMVAQLAGAHEADAGVGEEHVTAVVMQGAVPLGEPAGEEQKEEGSDSL